MPNAARAPLPQLLVPLAGLAASAAFVAYQVDPAAAGEGAYLAFQACLVLLPVAALAAAPATELALGAVLSTALIWALPAGDGRGAAHSLVLVAVLGIAAARRFRRSPARHPRPSGWLALWAGLALHFLFRADELLAIEASPATLGRLLLPPVVAAAAVALLARGREPLPLLAAAAAALVLGRGWSPAAALALAALAAGDRAARGTGRPLARWAPLLLVGGLALLVGIPDPVGGGSFGPALVLLAAGAALAARRRASAQAAIAAVVLAAAAVAPAARSWPESLGAPALLLALLPAAPWAGRERAARILAAAALAVAALRLVPGPEAAIAPIALAALALPAAGAAARLQGLWSGGLVAAGALAASYPWLRAEPLPAALDLVGASAAWPSAVAVAAVLALLALATRLAGRLPSRWRPRALPLGLAALAVAAFLRIPAAGSQPLEGLPLVLSAERPAIGTEPVPGVPVRRIVVDSYLSNAAALAAGTPVAIVRLSGADGPADEWTLAAGRETGEWAARRPEVAARPGFTAPPAWVSWVAPDGRTFAQRYRAARELAAPLAVARVEIARAPGLPEEVDVAIFHFELRPR